jgi:tetratricopeptide (TPR) repeat protein
MPPLKLLFLVCCLLFLPEIIYCQSLSTSDSSNFQMFILEQKRNNAETNNQLARLDDRSEHYDKKVNALLTVLAILLALGTGFSIFGFIKSEMRESKSYKMALQDAVHNKEAIADPGSRENLVFTQSQRTLTLVNETLSLATEASKRASKSLETRLKKTMDDLEDDSREILDSSQAFDDDKNLTIDKDICSEIHRIGRKIEGLENNLVILEDANIILKPFCNFVRGADTYLSEQFNQGIEYWKDVANSPFTEQKLRSLAFYWIGYVYNNIGDFVKAKTNFKKAHDLAIDSRKYELSRILLETSFFNRENISQIITDLKKLIITIENDTSDESKQVLNSRRSRLLTTLGNVYYQFGTEADSPEDRKSHYQNSRKIFAELLHLDETSNILSQIQSLDNERRDRMKWVIFGYAESMFQLSENESELELSQNIFKKFIYHLAENEFLNREERRTKVLAKTTQLICAIRCKDDDILLSNIKSQVDSAIGGVDKRLTIYSQLQRRNVKREQLRHDIDKLFRQ